MQAPYLYRLKDQQFWLSPDRCLFWEEEDTLVVSDLHFGKTGHFRKSGIAVPQAVFKEDLQRLVHQVQHFQPKHLVVVGDFFHSHENKELDFFLKWRKDLSHLPIKLVRGNHDILEESWYAGSDIEVEPGQLVLNGFCFVHDIHTIDHSPLFPIHYAFTGHIHPGVRITGLGKQALRFPCFYFGESFAVLPAFSRFTGLALVKPGPGEQVFAIIENKVVPL